MRRSTTVHTHKPEAAGQIMAHPAFTVNEHDLIAALFVGAVEMQEAA